MENVIKLWLPIGAFLISIVSLLLSIFNMRFAKRFEGAKKRTELLSVLLDGMAVLSAKKEQLLSVKELCHGCPKSLSDELCSRYEGLIQSLERRYEEIEGMTRITDPIKVEHALSRQERLNRELSDFVVGIDSFIQKCRECGERPGP
jgi:hypothetical protein